jgi:ribosomal protein L11 methyltransferase
MKNKYTNVYVKILEENCDLAYGLISDFKFTGIEERMDEIVISFNSKDWNTEVQLALQKELERADEDAMIYKIEEINEKNWNEEWEKNIPLIVVNENIGIAPEWKKDELKTKIKLLINPKMTFGTGEHATTKLVCRLMENLIKKDSYWIDAGTGTGVLAILAAKLGARKIFAFDNNEWSIENTHENAKLNAVEDKIKISQEDIDEIELPECDGIAANLFKNLLIPSFPIFMKALEKSNGDLLVSGIIKFDKDEVFNSALEAGFEKIEEIYEDEWVAYHFKPKK